MFDRIFGKKFDDCNDIRKLVDLVDEFRDEFNKCARNSGIKSTKMLAHDEVSVNDIVDLLLRQSFFVYLLMHIEGTIGTLLTGNKIERGLDIFKQFYFDVRPNLIEEDQVHFDNICEALSKIREK